MKVVLRADVDGLGYKGDIVSISDGYAQNKLIPQGLAFKATAGAEKEAEKMLGQSIKSFRAEFWYDMKDKIISEKYQQKLLSKIKISKKEVLSFFNIYSDSLPLFPTEVKLRHLLIKPTPSDSIKKETIKYMMYQIGKKHIKY